MKTDYSKLRTKLYGIIEGLSLIDPKYYELRRLLAFAEQYHCNTRKDGSEEFSHQLQMLGLALTLHESMCKPFEVYMAIVSHDLIEDYPEASETLEMLFPDVIQYSRKLAKFKDSNTDEDSYYGYFNQLANCQVCSIVKLVDRVHNLSTAPGVFSTEKIMSYCDETDKYFFDMIKKSKVMFNQRSAYEVLKFMLNTEVSTIRNLLK